MVITQKTAAETLHSISSYLEAEDKAEVRHEFNNGKIEEMAGGKVKHNRVKGRVYSKLDVALDAPNITHVPLNSDTKVRIEKANRFVYPDITVSDGKPEYYETPEGKTREDIITNPLLIVEVLSDATRGHDKGEKFEQYASISTFREYILIEPEQCWIKSYFLQEPESDLWKITTLTDMDAMLPLRSLNMELSVQEIYAVLEKL